MNDKMNRLWFMGIIVGVTLFMIAFGGIKMGKVGMNGGATLMKIGAFIAVVSFYLFIITASIDTVVDSKIVSQYDASLSMYQSVFFIVLFGIFGIYSPTLNHHGKQVTGFDLVVTYLLILIVFVGSKVASKEMIF